MLGARATSAWWPAAGPVPARLPRSRRAQAHSGGAGPGAPAHGQVDVDGHVQQRQAVAAGAASKRPAESGVRQGALRRRPAPSCRGRISPRGSAVGAGWSGDRKPAGEGPRAGALASPDRVVLRSYGLRAVLGLGGGGKARGVSGLNGESPTLRGLLGTHVQAPGRSARGVAVRPLPGRRAPPPRARPPGRCSPAGGRGQSQAGSSCPSPGRGRTLRSRRSRAGVCGASRPGRRGGGLHCDPGRGALTSQNPFLHPGEPRAARALSAAASRELEGSGHGWRRPPAARWWRPRNRAWHPGPSADIAATPTGGATTHCLARGRGTEVT